MSEKTIQPEDLDEVVEMSNRLRLALDGLRHNAVGCSEKFISDIGSIQTLAEELEKKLEVLAQLDESAKAG